MFDNRLKIFNAGSIEPIYLSKFRFCFYMLVTLYRIILTSITLTINIVITLLRAIGIIFIGYYAVIYYYALAMTVFMPRRNKSRSGQLLTP